MTVRDYLNIFRERWRIVLACVLVGILAGAAVVITTPKQYSSEVTFFVSAQSTDPSTAYDDSLLAQQRIATYLELLAEPRLGEEVARRLGGDATASSVTSAITATSPPETSLIRVSVTETDPAGAQQIAAAVGEVFPSLVTSVETEADPTSEAIKIVARVLQPPSFPTAPVAPGVQSTLLLGLLLGLAVGLVAAVSRHGIDDSVRTTEALERAAGAPTLGPTGRDPSFAARPVIVGLDPSSPLAEAYADLRTHLAFALADTEHRVLVGTAPHVGAGTTSTLCNLAAALGAAGRRTVLVEADLRRPMIGTYLGLVAPSGLSDVLAGTSELEDCLQPWIEGRVDVVLAGPAPIDPAGVLASGRLEKVVDDLRHRYDLVLVDAPPALAGSDADLIAAASDATLLVARNRRTTRRAIRQTVAELSVTGTPIIGAVLTMVRMRGVQPAPKPTASGGGASEGSAGTGSFWGRIAGAFRTPGPASFAAPAPDAIGAESPAEPVPDVEGNVSGRGATTSIVNLTRRPSPRPRPAGEPTT